MIKNRSSRAILSLVYTGTEGEMENGKWKMENGKWKNGKMQYASAPSVRSVCAVRDKR
jgi:hypothetical protein